MNTGAIQVWASTLLCQFCGVNPLSKPQGQRKMTFGIAGARVLCGPCGEPFRQAMLNPPKPKAAEVAKTCGCWNFTRLGRCIHTV